MQAFLNADTSVVSNLLARLDLRSYTDISNARTALGQQMRLSMQHPKTYTIPLDQQLPESIPLERIAQYVHPFNVAVTLINVCFSGPAFGGEVLAPQSDLQVYVGEWTLLGNCRGPAVAMPEHKPEPEPLPLPEPIIDSPAAVIEQAGSAETADVVREEQPVDATAELALAADAGEYDTPDPDIYAVRNNERGRAVKSPFSKTINARSKVAAAPFWWGQLAESAPNFFTATPPEAVTESSTGAGPVQSYVLLAELLLRTLRHADHRLTVAALRAYIRDVLDQVDAHTDAEAINQLRDLLFKDDEV